jgi:hypothetical protein
MKGYLSQICLVGALFHFGNTIIAQTTDSTKSTLHFSGSISANNNGFSFVPTFSLGAPAIQTGFNISRNNGRFSFHPQFWYSMLDYKPWSFIFIWRYKVVKQGKFDFTVGTHAPAINFKSATVSENGVEKEVIKSRRFYPVLELLPVYKIRKNISLSLYSILAKGIEKEVATTNFFLSLRTDFTDLPLGKRYFLRFQPQVYYLSIGRTKGIYAAASLSLAHRKCPFSIGTMMSQALKSEIMTKNFDWNLSLTYAFGKNYGTR